MNKLFTKPIQPFNAELMVPGDKSISHRAVILAALSDGLCIVSGFLPSDDCLRTVKAAQDLGVKIELFSEESEKSFTFADKDILEQEVAKGAIGLRIHGIKGKFKKPDAPIDCGNSGTTMRLFAGALANSDFSVKLIGDESLCRRPMNRIIKPLNQMGAEIESLGKNNGCAPLVLHGGDLRPLRCELSVASAQVKSAILLAGLFAKGKTQVIEPSASRDHTEIMLKSMGVKILHDDNKISIYGGQTPRATDIVIPGDPSSAAYWIATAASIPHSRLAALGVGLNATRTAFLRVLVRMGAVIREIVMSKSGERFGTIEAEGRRLKGTVIEGEEIPKLIDELPLLAVIAAAAEGRTIIRHANELRVKETDRISATVYNLQKMGVAVKEYNDGMVIEGGRRLKGAKLKSFGDHRIAMSFAVAGLLASGECLIENTDCINISYPGFEQTLAKFIQQGESKGNKISSS